MNNWKDSIHRQRETLAGILREPLAQLAGQCTDAWGDCQTLDAILDARFAGIPHCSSLYCVSTDGIQLSNNVGPDGVCRGYFGCDRSQRPYMNEAVPAWGFLLSDAYISLNEHRPSLTALQVVSRDGCPLGYLGADFDLRNLPATADLYEEPGCWRQVKGDPAIRGGVFQQRRTDSAMDGKLEQALAILEELLTQRGVFQCQINFSSSQATVWTADDPFRYRILDHEALSDPDICLAYPARAYPPDAAIPQHDIAPILDAMRTLRLADPTFYLRMASINLVNDTVSATFSCDGTHYMPHAEFLKKGTSFWF